MTSITLTPLEQKLRYFLLDVADYIGRQPKCRKPELRITGGWVRDRLLGMESKDIDIGINSMTGFRFATFMKQYLESPEGRSKYDAGLLGNTTKIEANPEKSKHLETVFARIMGLNIDLVNLRRESYTDESRTPTMEFGTPEEDALRRDSTVNALFYNLTSNKVEDFTGRGLKDMDQKIIRTPLEPHQTFKDDPLRILRCIRFASKLGYRIDDSAKASMGDEAIKEALKRKISRERVGDEFEKMLRGPDPCTALRLIDESNLYNTIFADPKQKEHIICSTENWAAAYASLQKIGTATVDGSMRTLRLLLLRDDEDTFLAWYLCSLVPWAKLPTPKPQNGKTKPPPPLAANISREALACPTRIMNVVKDAVNQMKEIWSFTEHFATEISYPESPSTAGTKPGRVELGMAIRRWGPYWRSSVMYALLTQLVEAGKHSDRDGLVNTYAAFLTELRTLDLLDIYAAKPILDGNQTAKALGEKQGPWMMRALEIAMEWQLGHPDNAQAEDAIAELLRRRSEFLPP